MTTPNTSGWQFPNYPPGTQMPDTDPGMPSPPPITPTGFQTGGMMGSNGQIMPQSPGAVGLGWNLGTAQLGFQGLASLGNLWNSWQANNLARDSFNFTKGMAERNLANSIASYNTQLEDRSRARAATEGQDAATAQAYVDRNRLPR